MGASGGEVEGSGETQANVDAAVMSLASMVIARLFSIGLGLTSTLKIIERESASVRLAQAIDDTDALIRDLRSAVFGDHRVSTESTMDEMRRSLHYVINLADGAQSDGPTTAELVDFSHCLRRALLQLDSEAQ